MTRSRPRDTEKGLIMHWSVTLLMAAALGANSPESTQQFDSYSKAYQTANEAHRPMLVILNPAGETDQAVSLDALQQSETSRAVLNDYVVAVVDTGTEQGQKVYELFGKPTLPRTIVIDERQEKQIFRTSDKMQPQTLTAVLEQYRNGVPQTVTAARPIISQPTISQPAVQGSLNYYQPAAGTCPNCRKF